MASTPSGGGRGALVSLLWFLGSFLIPLALWAAVSYVPWIWHSQVFVEEPGGPAAGLSKGSRVEAPAFAEAVARATAAGEAVPSGQRVNPVFLPAPHEVALAFHSAFTTPPVRKGDPWFHQSLLHSLSLIAQGFAITVAIGLPLGVLCGSFRPVSRLTEPFVDFIRYMPAPAFGALAVAVFGINDAPKIAIIVLGTVFHTILVIANTTRTLDHALADAALTLGVTRRQMILRVVLPGIAPGIWNDLRIMLGAAWTMLIVAELIGAMSGVSLFINQQGKYRNYDNVFVGIICVGILGILVDQILAAIGGLLFPWQDRPMGLLGRLVARIRRRP
ncbi:MAG: hypothetical protein RLZZ127_1674 [Planctomycetota bacterium]|jgi:NitT/TauT family transport system permease protein